jgi:hypothetical protein
MSAPLFKVGDKVTWSSQANGHRTTKVGTVVDVVPSGERPEWHKRAVEISSAWSRKNMSGPRKHESYLIVTHNPKRLYWPVVDRLRLVTGKPRF